MTPKTKDDEEYTSNDEARDHFLEEGLPIQNGTASGPHVRPSKKAQDPSNRLSVISQKYDTENKGHLDEAQQKMRDMDTSNRGFLTNEKVYGMMLDHMKMQREMFTMKRIVIGLTILVLVLSVAMLGVAWAAAILAKDTRVEGGNLMVKGGEDILGTRPTGKEYVPTKLTGNFWGRRDLLLEVDATNGLTKREADEIFDQCLGAKMLIDCGGTNQWYEFTSNHCHLRSKSKGGAPVYKFPQENPKLTIDCPNGGPSTDCALTFAESCSATTTTTTTVTPSTAARLSTCPSGDIIGGSDCSAHAPELECITTYSCTNVAEKMCTCDGGTSQWSCDEAATLLCTDDIVNVECADEGTVHHVGRDPFAACGPCNHICQDGSVATETGPITLPEIPLNGPATTVTPSTAARVVATECPAARPNQGDACSSSAISKCNYNPTCCCENDLALFEYSYDCSNDAFGPPAVMGLRCGECAQGVNAFGPCDNVGGCSGTLKHNNTVCKETP